MPIQLKNKVAKGKTITFYSNDLMAVKWMDKREVSILSIFHGSEMTAIKIFLGNKQKPLWCLTTKTWGLLFSLTRC